MKRERECVYEAYLFNGFGDLGADAIAGEKSGGDEIGGTRRERSVNRRKGAGG